MFQLSSNDYTQKYCVEFNTGEERILTKASNTILLKITEV